jgi:hypothetical protein
LVCPFGWQRPHTPSLFPLSLQRFGIESGSCFGDEQQCAQGSRAMDQQLDRLPAQRI